MASTRARLRANSIDLANSVNGGHPLVSVITPVRNGEPYLRACIDSVLSQTYRDWEYVIVNNCSTDQSLEIAQGYAKSDPRICVHTNQSELSLMQNWNNALRQVSARAEYCKVVHADDLLFSTCLEQMVEVGVAHSSVGVIGAYRIDEDCVNLDAMPYKTTVVPGRELCRRRLLGGADMFGSPSSLMIRADLIRGRDPFYNEQNSHADSEACFDLLRECDFGFVHQVLTYTRRHNESVTSYARQINTHKASHFFHLVRYGPYYLNEEEYARRYKKVRQNYYRFLAQEALLSLIDKQARARRHAFWEYHRNELAGLHQPLSRAKLARSMLAVLFNKGLDKLKV
jgi:glycosyltransferase involved in cell wall biosynthesis